MPTIHDSEEWRDAVTKALNRLEVNQEQMSARLGKESEDVGGSGLYGKVIRMEADVKSLLSDRNMLCGATAILIGLSAFIFSNLKS